VIKAGKMACFANKYSTKIKPLCMQKKYQISEKDFDEIAA
jgi:hypothetical protein